jgi:hypothetical protein
VLDVLDLAGSTLRRTTSSTEPVAVFRIHGPDALETRSDLLEELFLADLGSHIVPVGSTPPVWTGLG